MIGASRSAAHSDNEHEVLGGPDPQITLYHYPGACSLVTVCALEMSNLPYRLTLVNLGAGEHHKPEYLSVSPLGKVPYMIVDGQGIAENAALITYLASERPKAGIFPEPKSSLDRAEAIGGLSFCSGTLHPIVRGLFNPGRLTTGETEGVKHMAEKLAGKAFGYAEQRLSERGWWLGEVSIVDVYLYWAFGVAIKGGIDPVSYQHLTALEERLKVLPSFVATIEEEQRSKVLLAC